MSNAKCFDWVGAYVIVCAVVGFAVIPIGVVLTVGETLQWAFHHIAISVRP